MASTTVLPSTHDHTCLLKQLQPCFLLPEKVEIDQSNRVYTFTNKDVDFERRHSCFSPIRTCVDLCHVAFSSFRPTKMKCTTAIAASTRIPGFKKVD